LCQEMTEYGLLTQQLAQNTSERKVFISPSFLYHMVRTEAQVKAEIVRLTKELEELQHPENKIERLLKETPGVLVNDKWRTGATIGFKLQLETDLSTITDEIREETGYFIHGFASTGGRNEFRVWFHPV